MMRADMDEPLIREFAGHVKELTAGLQESREA